MRRWFRYAAISVGALAALWVLLHVVGGALWAVAGSLATARHQRLVQRAQEFGRSNTAEACIVAALEEADRCRNVRCAGEAQDFLGWSLTTARGTSDLCREIPRDPDSRNQWVAEQCIRRGREQQPRCLHTLRGVLVTCPTP